MLPCCISWVSDLEKLPGSAMWHVSIPRLRWRWKFSQQKAKKISQWKRLVSQNTCSTCSTCSTCILSDSFTMFHPSSCRHRWTNKYEHAAKAGPLLWAITLNKALTKIGAPVLPVLRGTNQRHIFFRHNRHGTSQSQCVKLDVSKRDPTPKNIKKCLATYCDITLWQRNLASWWWDKQPAGVFTLFAHWMISHDLNAFFIFLSHAICMDILGLFNGLEGKLMQTHCILRGWKNVQFHSHARHIGFVPVNRAFLKMTCFSGYDRPRHSQKINN